MKHRIICWLFLVVWSLGWVTNASAQNIGNIAVHGFGGWAYGKTDNENRYLVGNEDGSYDAVNFSLNISANPYTPLTLYLQPSYTETMDGNETGLDYAFAEWYFADVLTLRIGKVKAPFMLATEVYDVGTIRPFFALPPGVYQQIAAEAYKGAGITGSLNTRGGWGFQYDIYGGKLSLLPNLTADLQDFQFESITPVANDLIGGRLMLQPPLNGLNAAISSYTGNFDFGQGESSFFNDRYVLLGASLEYLTDSWWLRSEYLTQEQSSKAEAVVVYVEVAYKVTSHWQVAARYESAEYTPHSPKSQYAPASLFDHEEVALGINYWLNPNLVFKLSYHLVKGNRLAFPGNIADYLQCLQRGSFDEDTHLIMVGTQFSF